MEEKLKLVFSLCPLFVGGQKKLKRKISYNATGIKEVNKKNKMRYCPINRNCLKKVTLLKYAVNFFYSFLLILCYRSVFYFSFFRGGEKK